MMLKLRVWYYERTLPQGIYVLWDEDTFQFLGSCHTTGGAIWLDSIWDRSVERYGKGGAIHEMRMLCHRRLIPIYVASTFAKP